MWPYFLILFLSLFFFYQYKQTKLSVYLYLTILVLALFVGLRSNIVGTDTSGYARMFFAMKRFQDANAAAEGVSTEDGWNILNWALVNIYPRYWFLFSVVGFFTVSCAIYVINKESPAKVLSLFVYFTLAFYLFGFAGMRQGMAFAFYCLALPFLFKRKFIIYAIIVLLGSLFHRTVLVALPLYFVFNMRYSNWLLVLVVIGSLVLGYFLPRLLALSSYIEGRYSIYLKVEGGGELFAVFYTAMAFFFWTQRKMIVKSRQQRYDTLLWMLIVGSMIYLVVVLSGFYGEITRLALYFQLAIVFLWAELYRYRKQKFGSMFWVGIALAHLVYLYLYLSKIGDIVPYVFNSSFN